MNATSFFEAAQNYFNIDLRLNTARVESTFVGGVMAAKEIKWWNFDNYMRSMSGTTSADFVLPPLFSANLRVAMMQRQVDVRYQTMLELFAEFGATWGWWLEVVAAFGILYRSCQDASFRRQGTADNDGEKQNPSTNQRKLLATQDEVTALKEQLQLMREALVKATGVELPEATATAEAEALSPPAEP
eukprot:COSAG04_NODE_1190_length_7830_cov_2.663433_8_plen_188_part_00